MQKLREEIAELLSPGETVLMILKQSRFSNIAPDSIVVTDRNLMLIHYSFWGLYAKRNILEMTESTLVPYDRIAGLLIDKGRFFTTVTIKIAGFGQSDFLKNTLGIEGLWHNDAGILVSFVQGYKNENLKSIATREVTLEEARRIVYEDGSRYVWLGRGSRREVARVLGVDERHIVTVDPGTASTLWATELEEVKGGILVDNYGALSPIMSRYLKKTYGINTFVLKGGTREIEISTKEVARQNQLTRWFGKPGQRAV